MDLNGIFSEVLRLSLTASVVILIVVCARLLLRAAPKIYSYLLWALVLIRLLCPLSIPSPLSVLPEPVTSGEIVSRLAEAPAGEPASHPDPPIAPVVQEVSPAPVSSPDPEKNTPFPWIWLAGMGGLLLYGVLSYIKIRRRVRIAVPLRKNVYLADDISTPFVMGFFPPKIYLPGTLTASERDLILCHEERHIRRGDPIFKALGFLALSVHWFNPLVWLAFILACRDMEMSCDEAVIRMLGEPVRADYSAALLNVAVGHRFVPGAPLAFGEGSPKGRIRNLANWKKTTIWVILLCFLLCAALAACLLTDPGRRQNELIYSSEQYYTLGEQKVIESGTATDHAITVKFKSTSGPRAFVLDVQYKAETDANWTNLESFQLESVSKTCVLHVPAGCTYQITATPTQGESGYSGFEISYRDVFSLRSVGKSGVNRISMWNTQRGTDTVLTNAEDVSEICRYLDGISGVDFGTVRVIPGVLYEIELYADTQSRFHVVFGDNSGFVCGKGSDGYPIRYELLETDLQDVAAFFSRFDSSGFPWAVSIQPERVSRTGATAAFVCSGSDPGVELTYGDYMYLERLEDGVWHPVRELPGYITHWNDASYPVRDGYGMVHEWDNRFGALPDGVYRIGKLVTLHRPDGSSEQQMVYGEFSIPESIPTGPLPLEDLPERYGGEEAMIDGCLVLSDGGILHNKELFQRFAKRCASGEPGFFRIVNGAANDPERTIYDLTFDGETYTLEWLADGRRQSRAYRCLMRYAGEKERADQDYDAYEHYVLVNDDTVSWQDIFAQSANVIDHWTVYSDYIYYPKSPEIPKDPVQAVLMYKGDPLVTVTAPARLKSIYDLFADSERMGYEPKTHSVGVGLDLVITGRSGEVLTIELDPDQDICRVNGEYVFYGAFDEPDYVLKLWEHLGIDQWPDPVYRDCPNALRP